MRLAIVLALLLALPATAAAETLNVDFETGPPLDTPVTDEYLQAAFVRWVKEDNGWRPHRLQAIGKARSGSIVANVDGRQCFAETGDSFGCEFPYASTEARLTRSARTVTVHAGLFQAGDGVRARLIGIRANNTTITGASVPISDGGFTTAVSVTSGAFDLIRWRLEAVNASNEAVGASLGFDDLQIEYDPAALPEIVPSTPSTTAVALQGLSTDVPVDITRINSSSGPVKLTATGLPTGVTATSVPDPVTGSTATLRLTAAPDAPEAGVTEATIVADPQNNANVAPAPRTTTLNVRVANPYALRLADGEDDLVELPACGPADLKIVGVRDETFAGSVKFTVEGLPAGVTAEILPSDTGELIGSSGVGTKFFNPKTIRLTRGAGIALPPSFTIRATTPGLADRTMVVRLARATPAASLTSSVGLTPRHRTDGTRIEMTGNGFCPGATLRVGNTEATVTPTIDSPTTLSFNVPRLATTGPVTVLVPGEASYTTSNTLTVRSFRNTNGFQFDNFPYGHLAIDELADAFGADDLFIKVNPCWPWGSCTIVTGILNPVAAIAWGIIDIALHQSGGHCFGISRAVQQLVTHKKPYNAFTTGGTVFSIPSATGPSSFLTSYLDGQHALQASSEFLSAFLHRSDNIFDQIVKLDTELKAGRDPIVSLKGPNFGEGHAIIAYDLQTTADGYDIFVYDNNQPFTPTEETSASHHKSVEENSVIHYNRFTQRWDFPGLGWSGGNDGSLFVAPQSVIPQDPDLAGLSTLGEALSSLVFGSADGSVRTVAGSGSKDAEFLPVLDSHATPGAAGQWVAGGAKPVSAAFEGVKDGTYDQAFTSPGFVGGIAGVETAKGVRDQLNGAPGELTFTSGQARDLTIELARQGKGDAAPAWAATVDTNASKSGSDSAGLGTNGQLDYEHDGAPTTMSFSLSRVREDGGPARFDSGTVTIGRGDKVVATPSASLETVRLKIRKAGGATTTRTLRNRAKAPARLRLSSLRVRGRRASVTLTTSRLRGDASGGVVLRLRRGAKVVARKATAIKRARNGRRTITWTLPRGVKGRYRLLADARLVQIAAIGAPQAGSATARRSAPVTVR